MTDDELWTYLRAEATVADVDTDVAAAIRARAHDRLRHPHRPLSTTMRATESIVVTFAVIAQLTWAWRVVLG
ncbi:MAG: hypothetical protein K8M05_17485 [Deltaproteobacteria bacterium]|nr:hypothetical protein [Kofleriaceae bacterium]